MRTRLLLTLLFVAAINATAAVKIGDTYESVIAEKGTPGGKMNARGLLLLVYPDTTIKLKEGRVVSIDAPKDATVATDAPAPEPDAKQRGNRFGTAVWNTDYEFALQQAREQNRHVFVFFTGSDWCGWCMRLKDEILSTPEFQNYAREKLVLVELDFPKRRELAPKLAQQNARLAAQYAIRGYPTVVVLNSRGKQIDTLGYQPGGPGPFIHRLRAN